ncbi:hypothetical protein HZH68_004753 [Vespula germanica]|uniref:Uncharacterized protein n=1 Tax=Vespula germanica TaxID=30212 RepID=A0A834NI81_VESGE|nr:hypothetical protein HZH68_004753 [Vespula germanica]
MTFEDVSEDYRETGIAKSMGPEMDEENVISSARLAVSKVPSKQSKALGTKQARNVGLCDRPQDLARNRFALAHCDNGL